MNNASSSNTVIQRWQGLALLLVIGMLLWLLGPILAPFVISALLAWLGDPLATRLERAGLSRTTAVIIVFALMSLLLIVALLILVPLLETQIGKFINWLPSLATWITATALPWVKTQLRVNVAGYIDPAVLMEMLKNQWQQHGGPVTRMLGRLSNSGMTILHGITNLFLIPVVTFYFLRDWRPMLKRIRELLPRSIEPTVVNLALQSNEVLGGFLRGQFSVMLSLGSIYAVGLWMAGLDLGLLIGFVAGLVSFVPYLGAFIGVSAAVIATLVQHGDAWHLALVLIVFGVGQMAESLVLIPWLVGDRIGMHPVAVIFAIMAGGQLFGFLGVLLALPVAAVAMVLLRYAHHRYTGSSLYGALEKRMVIVSVCDDSKTD